MQTERLTERKQMERIYRTRITRDFVRNERRPLASLKRSWRNNEYECYGLMDNGELMGYAFFVRHGGNYLFDYLAIAEEHRDEGLGTIFLRQLAECLRGAECIVGEVEDPDRAADEATRLHRERRMRFYLRSGYRKTVVTSTVFGADYRLLEIPTGREHTAEEIRAIYTELYRSILPGMFFRTQFQLF